MNQLNINEYQPQIPSVSGNDKRRLKEQTDAFEAIILKMILDQAIEGKNPLLPEDPGRKIYQSMMNEERSRQLSGTFGYSELLFNYLVEKNS
ncbi:Rod binding protein [Hydrogenimonas sp.]|uniref:Rod binding protein n=1 Tax=Hydrogenimonas sp. TaxID=2231112 RepID=UPI002621C6E1|nr:Rod binding protein [Hydrogenimonas sp.]